MEYPEDVDDWLPGTIYFVPDSVWGFRAYGRQDHPGACLFCYGERNSAVLSKGTDSRGGVARGLDHPYHVLPDDQNGLRKPTTFNLVPRRIRLRKVLLWEPERRLGELDRADRKAMQAELRRIFVRGDASRLEEGE